MKKLNKEYYYMDVNFEKRTLLKWGTTQNATLTGDTDNPKVHRIFLTKGQYNKFSKKVKTL